MRDRPEWIGRTDNTPIPVRVKDRVSQRAQDCCQQCKRPIMGKLRGEFDHIVPLILGGENRESNLQLLCKPHHDAKTKLDDEDQIRNCQREGQASELAFAAAEDPKPRIPTHRTAAHRLPAHRAQIMTWFKFIFLAILIFAIGEQVGNRGYLHSKGHVERSQ